MGRFILFSWKESFFRTIAVGLKRDRKGLSGTIPSSLNHIQNSFSLLESV